VNTLALSGGGANGAYGAGLIYGWTKTGQRPRFQIVTGVSAGALTAPFAFLGPAWDEQLRRMYYGDEIHHLLQTRGLFALFGSGFYRKSPLEHLVRGYVTDDVLRAVAAEQAKGRRLLVATTNLDTEQLIVWDLGAIAAHGGAEARELFAEVLIASASVPGVFPPTLIEVQGAGLQFAEMHVDGQAESPFFAVTQRLVLTRRTTNPLFRPHIFVVVNGQRESEFVITERATIPILTRTLDTASKASIRAVLAGAQEFCQRNGCDLRVSDLPATEKSAALDFSAAHLESLFAAGEAAIQSGQAWTTAAPLPPKQVQTPPNP
jgi:predicted acylesterase/phospholipase RssA